MFKDNELGKWTIAAFVTTSTVSLLIYFTGTKIDGTWLMIDKLFGFLILLMIIVSFIYYLNIKFTKDNDSKYIKYQILNGIIMNSIMAVIIIKSVIDLTLLITTL